MYGFLRRRVEAQRAEWRAARLDLFFRVMRPADGMTILDLGGHDGRFMLHVARRVRADITVADVDDRPLLVPKRHGFRVVTLAEGRPLPFADRQFDVVFCNSTIEHVTLPKAACGQRRFRDADWVAASMRSQRAFAAEVRRVGKGYFVQTPHRAFPVEAHTWLPFVGWLSHDATVRLVRVTDRFWVARCGSVDWHLLGEREMRELLPDATIHVERVLGLPKSIVAYRDGRAGAPGAT